MIVIYSVIFLLIVSAIILSFIYLPDSKSNSSAECKNLPENSLGECCENWARESGIVHILCVGGWIFENETCKWKCSSGL